MKTLTLADGHVMPRFGLGTWRMGEDGSAARAEVALFRHALEIGYRLFDTAEMYGEGGAELRLGAALGQALAANTVRREDITIVSKVYPHNAGRQGAQNACAASLKRLGLDTIDLYLLHWPSEHPLTETVEAFMALIEAGRIRSWGVSNFDCDDLDELARAIAQVGASPAAVNQIFYALNERGPEFALLPAMRAAGLATMAYSPLDQGALSRAHQLTSVARQYGHSASALALGFVMRDGDVIAIPKSSQTHHLEANLAAASTPLTAEVIAALERIYPPPAHKTPLAVR